MILKHSCEVRLVCSCLGFEKKNPVSSDKINVRIFWTQLFGACLKCGDEQIDTEYNTIIQLERTVKIT